MVVQRREWAAGMDPDIAAQRGFNRADFDLGHKVIQIDGEHDLFGDGSVVCLPTYGHTPGHQSLLVHLKNSGFILLSGDVVHLEENFEKNIVPSLNTNKAQSIASMEKVRRLIAAYKAALFINHDKSQTDKLKLLPAFYD